MEQKNELEKFLQESFDTMNDNYEKGGSNIAEIRQELMADAKEATKQSSERAFAYIKEIQKYYHSAREARKHNIPLEQWLDEQLSEMNPQNESPRDEDKIKNSLKEIFEKARSSSK